MARRFTLPSVYRCKDNNALSDLLFELITKITQSVHVNALNLSCKEFHTLDIYDLVHDIAKRSLSQFALEGFVLALERFDLCLEMCDLLSNFCRLCLAVLWQPREA